MNRIFELEAQNLQDTWSILSPLCGQLYGSMGAI